MTDPVFGKRPSRWRGASWSSPWAAPGSVGWDGLAMTALSSGIRGASGGPGAVSVGASAVSTRARVPPKG